MVDERATNSALLNHPPLLPGCLYLYDIAPTSTTPGSHWRGGQAPLADQLLTHGAILREEHMSWHDAAEVEHSDVVLHGDLQSHAETKLSGSFGV